jgi:multiple sugar transport system substrate-binding protein
VDVPGTWDAYLDAARTIVGRTGVRGFAQRGTDAWHTMYTGFATQLWSCGGRDFEDGRCAIASPVAVEVTEAFVAALRDAGPEDWPDQRWYELALDFGRGRYGLIVDSDHYVAYFEDPAVSPLAGQIGYAPPPAGPDGRRSNLWTWSVVVNTRARDLDAVRRFVEWATGRSFLLRSAFEGNMNPTRRSIWDDDRFRAHTSGWGDFHDVARNLIEHDASVLVTPAPNYLAIASRWVAALLAAYSSGDIRGELEAAAVDIDELV